MQADSLFACSQLRRLKKFMLYVCQHHQMIHRRILCSLHGASLFLRIQDILDHVVRDHLTRRQNRDSRRITHHKLRTDSSGRRFHRNGDLLGVERFLRGHHDLRGDILTGEKSRAVLFVETFHIIESPHKALDVLDTISDGDVSQNVADVTEFDLDIILVAQKIIDLDSRKSDVSCIHRELRHIVIEDAVAVHQFFSVSIVATDGVDLPSRVFCHLNNLREGFLTAESQISS